MSEPTSVYLESTYMDNNQNKNFRLKIEPVDEEAILRDLAQTPTTEPTPPIDVPQQTPIPTDLPPVDTPMNIIPASTAQLPPQLASAPTTIPEQVPDLEVNKKIPLLRLILVGAGIALLYDILRVNAIGIFVRIFVQNIQATGISSFSPLLASIPYVCGAIVALIGAKFASKINSTRPFILSIATVLFSIGLGQLLSIFPLSESTALGDIVSRILGSSIYLQYFTYAVAGAIAIVAITFIMKLLTRITNEKLFIAITLVVSLAPIGISNLVGSFIRDSFVAQTISPSSPSTISQSSNSTLNDSPVTTPSTITKTDTASSYTTIPQGESMVYKDALITFSYPSSWTGSKSSPTSGFKMTTADYVAGESGVDYPKSGAAISIVKTVSLNETPAEFKKSITGTASTIGNGNVKEIKLPNDVYKYTYTYTTVAGRVIQRGYIINAAPGIKSGLVYGFTFSATAANEATYQKIYDSFIASLQFVE